MKYLRCVFVSCLLVLVPPSFAAGKNNSDRATRVTELKLLSSQLKTSASANELDRIIKRRRALLATLIDTAPASVLDHALSRSELNQLRRRVPDAGMAALLEQRGPFRGTLQRVYVSRADYSAQWEDTYLKINDKYYRLAFTQQKGGERLRSGAEHEVQGLQVGNRIVVSDVEPLQTSNATVFGSAGSTAATTTTAGMKTTVAGSIGEQTAIVLLVNFQDRTEEPWTIAEVEDKIFGPADSLDAFWRENSFGNTFINGDVAGWYTLPATTAEGCDIFALRSMAIEAADPDVNFSRYNRLFIVVPNSICGLGSQGVTDVEALPTDDGPFVVTTSWIGNNQVKDFAHEGGHNMGLGHAGYFTDYRNLDGVQESVGPLGEKPETSWIEFGDAFDVMGAGGQERQYNAPHKNLLGWLDPASIATVTTSGTFVLAPYELATAGTQVLKVYRGDIDTNTSEWFWIENRQPIGFDASLADSTTASAINGATIHLDTVSYGDSAPTSELVDMHLLSFPFNDQPLEVGESWTDPYTGITITVASLVDGNLTVDVDVPPLAVVHMTPAAGYDFVVPDSNTPVTATFSRVMDAATVNTGSFTLSDGAVSVAASVTLDTTGKFATLLPDAPLSENTTYTVTISGGPAGVQATGGESLASDFSWNFTTTPSQPSVLTVDPPTQTTGLSVTPTFTVTFSKPMDESTFTPNNFYFYRSFENVPLARTIQCNSPCTTAVMTPDAPLLHSTGYGLWLRAGSNGLLDTTGASLSLNKISSYTTVAEVDLLPADVSGPGAAYAGSTVTVSTTIQNQGGDEIGDSSRTGLYVSADTDITTADTLLDTRVLAGLGAGASNIDMSTVFLPASLAPGNYYYGAIADINGDIAETDESNNSFAGSTLTINAPPRDSDADGWSDDFEIAQGSDPADALSQPVPVADGDVNQDGTLNVADILIAQQIAQGFRVMTDEYRFHGDVAPPGNYDGVINVADILLITRSVLEP